MAKRKRTKWKVGETRRLMRKVNGKRRAVFVTKKPKGKFKQKVAKPKRRKKRKTGKRRRRKGR